MEITGRPFVRPINWDTMQSERGTRAKESSKGARVSPLTAQVQAARTEHAYVSPSRMHRDEPTQTSGVDTGPSYQDIVEALYKAADAARTQLSKPPLEALSAYTALMEDVGDLSALQG
ncbi:MAG TPA: hypothetical protein VL424_05915, partial [Pararobbsia sp.]|nr:hypothetical protein [Pararobbsia sp.]